MDLKSLEHVRTHTFRMPKFVVNSHFLHIFKMKKPYGVTQSMKNLSSLYSQDKDSLI